MTKSKWLRRSDGSFRFGDSEEIKAIESVEIPVKIIGHCTSFRAELVSKDIPLLLNKKAMKDTKVNINFFKIGIHSMQDWTVTRKKSTKRLRHTGNLFRKNPVIRYLLLLDLKPFR